MTRAKRYANHAGGRKYDAETGEELPKSTKHVGAQEKLEASQIFREAWELCKKDETYHLLKAEFMKEQREWDRRKSEHRDSREN
jgi:hypothetical protein